MRHPESLHSVTAGGFSASANLHEEVQVSLLQCDFRPAAALSYLLLKHDESRGEGPPPAAAPPLKEIFTSTGNVIVIWSTFPRCVHARNARR